MHIGNEQPHSIISVQLTTLIYFRQKCCLFTIIYMVICMAQIRILWKESPPEHFVLFTPSTQKQLYKEMGVKRSSDTGWIFRDANTDVSSSEPWNNEWKQEASWMIFTFISRLAPQWSKRHLCPRNGSLSSALICSGLRLLCMDFISERSSFSKCAIQDGYLIFKKLLQENQYPLLITNITTSISVSIKMVWLFKVYHCV